MQDIIDRPNVRRAAFYSHFDHKDDLLSAGSRISALHSKAGSGMLSHGAVRSRNGPGLQPGRLSAHSRVPRRVPGDGRSAKRDCSPLLHKLVVELVREDVRRMDVRVDGSTAHADPLVHVTAGALVGVLMWWLDG